MGRVGRPAVRGLAPALAALLLLPTACARAPGASGRGLSHVVRPGENLYRIAQHYRVPVSRIQRANRIRDVTALRVGQRLWIPGTSHTTRASTPLTPPAEVAQRAAARAASAARETHLRFTWPVRGRVSSRFGWRWGRRHEGIDIPARAGTPIVAAEAGRVIHSGRGLGAYGNVVIVKHAGDYSTVYAHNRRNLVRRGDFVERGERIAEVGRTGNARGAHVHFEVRRKRRPQDPLAYLP